MSDYDLVKTLRMNYLFDFYQALLTKNNAITWNSSIYKIFH